MKCSHGNTYCEHDWGFKHGVSLLRLMCPFYLDWDSDEGAVLLRTREEVVLLRTS